MTDYDDLFAETAVSNSLFADKQALDLLRELEEIVVHDEQEH